MHVAASRVIEECCLSVLLVVVLLLLSGCRIASRTAADQHPMSRAPAITYRLSVQQLLHTCLSLSLSLCLSVSFFLSLSLSITTTSFGILILSPVYIWLCTSFPSLHLLPLFGAYIHTCPGPLSSPRLSGSTDLSRGGVLPRKMVCSS